MDRSREAMKAPTAVTAKVRRRWPWRGALQLCASLGRPTARFGVTTDVIVVCFVSSHCFGRDKDLIVGGTADGGGVDERLLTPPISECLDPDDGDQGLDLTGVAAQCTYLPFDHVPVEADLESELSFRCLRRG
jgi:hypothetical protein